MRILLFFLFVVVAYAYDPPVGIPDPQWPDGLHPIDTPNPSQPIGAGQWPTTVVTDWYYIDNQHGSATDSSNPNGTPDLPRLTIPEGTFSAGTVFVLRGVGYTTQGQIITTFNGTSVDPCWVLGDGLVNLQGEWIIKGEYLIVDGVGGTQAGAVYPRINIRTHGAAEDSDHICVRNGTFTGDGSLLSNGTALGCYGAVGEDRHDFVFYNNTISGWGIDDPAQTENDRSGFGPDINTYNIWILENTVFDMGGDGAIVGRVSVTGGNVPVDNVYIGGNHFYSNHEDGIDIKTATDIVLSENILHDFDWVSSSSGGGVVVHDDNERVSIINNTIYNCQFGIIATKAVNMRVVGNVIYDCIHTNAPSTPSAPVWDADSAYSGGTAIHMRGTMNADIANNTIFNCDFGIQVVTQSVPGTIYNNAFGERSNAASFDLIVETTPAPNMTVDRNFYDSTDIKIRWAGAEYTDLATFQGAVSQEANAVSAADPEFVSTTPVYNFAPSSASSPLVDAASLAAVYTDLNTLYGLDFAVDINGGVRPQGAAWDAGAYEYSAQTPTTTRNRNSAARTVLSGF